MVRDVGCLSWSTADVFFVAGALRCANGSGRETGKEKNTTGMKRKWENPSHSLVVHRWSVIGTVEIDFQVNHCDVPPQSWPGNNLSSFASRDAFRPLPRRAALISHFNIPDSSCGLFTSQPSLQSAEQYLSIKAADLLIDKKESDVRKEQIWELLEEKKRRTILKGKSIWIISLSLSWQQPWIVHLRIINHCLVNPLQVLSVWVNANAFFFSFFGEF